MKRIILIIFFIVFVNYASFSQIANPDNIIGLKMWLTSDSVIATGGFVTGMYDRSGLGNNVYQNSTNAKPVLIDSVSTLNKYPVIQFDGVNDYLISNNVVELGNTGASIFIITKLYSHTTYGMFVCYGVNNPGSWNFRLRSTEPKNTLINGANNNGAGLSNLNTLDLISSSYTILFGSVDGISEKWKVGENGIFKDSVILPFSQANSNYITVGYRNDGISHINADIAEIIIYNRELSSEEHQQIVDYLRNRYAPPVELGPSVKLVCDTSITLRVPEYFSQVTWSTGSTSDSITVNHSDTISVQVTDVFGFVSTDTIILKAFQNPFTFNMITDTLTCGESISWDPGLDSSLYSFLWSTGDTSPVCTITNSGLYSVVVSDLVGCSVSSPSINVIIDEFSSLTSLGNDTSLCTGDTISLITSNTNVVNYLWQDNTTDSCIVISSPGDYWVRVTNNNGCTATDTINVTVKGVVPTVGFILNNSCEESDILFLDNSTVNDTGHIVSQRWDWGDGEPISYGDSVYHTYNSNGTYPVTLYINTSTGCEASLSENVIIFPKPMSGFDSYMTNSPLTLCLYENTTDYGLPIISRLWLYNNSIASLSSYYFQTFPDFGNYTVSFIATNIQGCTDTITQTVSVTSLPISNTEPNNISDLKLWLRPDSLLNTDSFDKISQWHDIAGNNNSFVQSNLLFQPLYLGNVQALNNHPVIRFDGIDDGLISYAKIVLGGQGATIFMVEKLYSNTNYGMSLCYGINYEGDWNFRLRPTEPKISFINAYNNVGAGLTNLNSLDLVNSNYTILSGTVNTLNNKWKIIENNTVKDSVYTSFVQADENLITIAYRNDGIAFLNAEIAEIILYNRELGIEEQQQIINYLRNRYAPPVELGPPVLFVCDTSITLGVPEYFSQVIWSTGGTGDSITVIQPDTIIVQATDIFGFVSTDTIILKSFQNKFNFNILPDSVSCGVSITWDPGIDSANYYYLWNTGQTTPTLTITNTGDYSVIITDTMGCPIESPLASIYFDPISLHTSLGPDTSLCSGNYLSLATGSSEVVSYLWSPAGETTSSIVLNNNSGWYGLTVTSANACTATDSIYISIHGTAPIAHFTTQNQCFGDSLVLTDSSWSLDLSNITQWDWTFHDNTTLTGAEVKKLYTAPGIYPVTLEIATDNSCSASVTLQVQVHYLPEPDFEIGNPCSDQPIQFYNNSALQGGGSITDYLWIVNGTDSFDVAAPVYNAGSPGQITVYLNATSNYGCVDEITKTFEIKQSPLAQFDISPSCSERKTYFFDLSESTVIYPIWKWDWDFGVAGAVSEMQNPEYIYTLHGDYEVTLEVECRNGCSDSYQKTVHVSASPEAGFSGQEACAGLAIVLTDTSTVDNGYIFSRIWTIENTGIFYDNVITLTLDSGDYTVNLEVVSELNCKDELMRTIRIHPLPVADFTVNKDLGGVPFTVDFTNLSTSGDYVWDFGDGGQSFLENPVYVYTDTGEYNVVLQVTDSNGCVQNKDVFISAVPNLYDLAILGMDTIVNGNMIKIAVLIANLGTLPVENPYLIVRLPNSQPFTETVNLTMYPDSIHYYIMSTGILINEAIDRSFLCAKIMLPAAYGTEALYSNNEYCLTSGNNISIVRIYPNPAKDEIIIEFSSGTETNADIVVNTVRGQKIMDQNIAVHKGLNRINLDLSTYTTGVYILAVKHNDGITIEKFVKSE